MPLFLMRQTFVLSFYALKGKTGVIYVTILMVVAGSDLMVARNGTSVGQGAFTSKEANEYLGLAWAQHLLYCGDHHNNIAHPCFHVSRSICNTIGNMLTRLSKRNPPVIIEYFL
jgi:hypothetical protein